MYHNSIPPANLKLISLFLYFNPKEEVNNFKKIHKKLMRKWDRQEILQFMRPWDTKKKSLKMQGRAQHRRTKRR